VQDVSGNVEVKGSGERSMLTVTTVSGNARFRTWPASEWQHGERQLHIAAGGTSRSRLRSTSGDIGLQGKLDADARIDFESISGNVRLDLQGPVGAEFEVSSFNGEIRNCFGPKAVRTSEYAPGTELRFREGAGTARVAHQDAERRYRHLQQVS